MKAILTFHSIDDSATLLSFPVKKFQQLIDSIVKSGVQICTLSDLIQCSTDNAVALTFDDGMRSVHQTALPIIREYDVPAHLFLTTGHVGGTNNWPTQPLNSGTYRMMSWDEILDCLDGGFSIDSHTVTHPFLSRISNDEVVEELALANEMIKMRTGRLPVHFSYPYGNYNDKVIDLAGELFTTCSTTQLEYLSLETSPVLMPRLDSYYLSGLPVQMPLLGAMMRAYMGSRRLLRSARQKYL